MESVLSPRKKSDRQTLAVRIDAAIVKKAKTIAADKGVDLSVYLSDALLATVQRDWIKIVKQIDNEG